MKWRGAVVAALAVSTIASSAGAQQQKIVNGGFETGDFTGWMAQVFGGSNGDVRASNGTTGFFSGLPTIGPNSGSWYGLTDMGGPGAYALSQQFTLGGRATSATLSFALSLTNWAGATVVGPDFNPFGGYANQWASVDLFSGAVSGFSTGSSLANFFMGSVLASNGANPYIIYTFDVTSLLQNAGTYTLRFAEVDNQLYHNMALDDVSLMVSTVPEPQTILLMATGLTAVAGLTRLRRRRSC